MGRSILILAAMMVGLAIMCLFRILILLLLMVQGLPELASLLGMVLVGRLRAAKISHRTDCCE